MIKCECGDMVRVCEAIDTTTYPVSSEAAGRIGIVENVVQADEETVALVWFGLYGDSFWIYLENLEEV